MHILCKNIIIALVSVLLFCSKSDPPAVDKVTELAFEVDSSKLEIASVDQNLKIQFNAPKGWTLIPPGLFDAFRQHDSIHLFEGTDVVLTPISIFLNQDSKSLLYISHLRGIQDSSSVESYKQLIRSKFSPAKAGNFLKGTILFTQYLIQSESRVNFKLLFFNSKNQLIQFDYIVPKESYLSELKAIESSIGSIKLID